MYAGHTNINSYCCDRFGRGSGPVYLDHVSCTGRESSLLDCIQDDEIGNVASHCSHYYDVAVRCPCKDFVYSSKVGIGMIGVGWLGNHTSPCSQISVVYKAIVLRVGCQHSTHCSHKLHSW